ncbi:hypothetical protein ATO3_12545 [Marinibacterium profundimaris]|uniref:2', 3'-cyclic nucleotide 2'-phosphodiesterase n=1 Tax=Marinibacterium profundimaris TaxID=1679460 RepID=A0A225NNG0_9RHOB|nr:hypothetical protein ATO3_12545 [Marinibacterium profundimaris]
MDPTAPADTRPDREAGSVGLRILATTDLHMHLCAHNYYTDSPDPASGLTRTASLIRAARAEAEAQGRAVLLLDNGDSLQGTPLGDVWVAEHGGSAGAVHPLMQAFAALGYDAIGLGNHDFDFGPEMLMRILRDAPCPVISTNLRGETGPIRRDLRLEVAVPGEEAIRVGLLSVLPPQTALWNAHHVANRFEIDDMVEAVREGAARLKAGGCDLVIVLAHTGLGAEDPGAGAENAAIPIAGLAQVDAVVAGHTHQQLPGPAHQGLDAVNAGRGTIHGRPVVMPGSAGSHLGVMDLRLRRGAGGWQLDGATVALRGINGADPAETDAPTPEDPSLTRLLGPVHEATRSALDQPVGRVPRRLHSYFSLFGPDHGLALVADAQAAAVRPAVDAAGLDSVPLLSAVAPCKFGARAGAAAFTDVPGGPATLRHVSDLHVYRNELRVVRLSGAQVLDWLEMSASLLSQIAPGAADQPLIPQDIAGYNFDVIHGLDYVIDPTRPARYAPDGRLRDAGARRVTGAWLDGAELHPGADLLVVANSYRVGGGGNFAALRGADQVPVAPTELREAVADHIRTDPAPGFAPPWRLTAPPGTRALARTGPAARALLDEIAPLAPEDLGLEPDGFLQLRLRF